MANTYSWAINALDTYPSQDSLADVVYNIHWGLTAESDQTDADGNAYTANSIGTQTVVAPDADDYTAFEDLTQEIVEAWLEASDLDVEAIKEGLDTQIVEKITPTSVTKQLPTA
jgi:hypothetical protein